MFSLSPSYGKREANRSTLPPVNHPTLSKNKIKKSNMTEISRSELIPYDTERDKQC